MTERALEEVEISSKPVINRATEEVRTEPWLRRVRGILGHETVVDSGQTLLQFEVQHLPVWYFPRADVRTDLFVPSAKRTKCPYKGTASYWDIVVGDRVVKDAVWSEDAVAGQRGHQGPARVLLEPPRRVVRGGRRGVRPPA